MRKPWILCPAAIAAMALAGCATIPTGPSVMVLPGQGKGFEQFQADDATCRQFASAQVGTNPGEASSQAGVSSAVIGTVLGAGLGAAVGAASGHPGVGAAIGAGGGALGGTMYGVGAGQAAAGTVQRRYDMAYQQCMYAKGNQIPLGGGMRSGYRAYRGYQAYPPPPPPPSSAPPPPPPPPQ